MSNLNNCKDIKEYEDYNSIKKLLKQKNLNPKKPNDLKYLLSLTLRSSIKKYNLDYLLNYLLKYLNSSNKSIFYEFLFQSCEQGILNNVKLLLENGLSVNCQNVLGETPLHIAILKNDIDLIKLLIKYEPNTNLTTDKNGLTVMNYAEIRKNKKIIKMIEDLIEKNKKELIKSEIIDYINKDMNNINQIVNEDINTFITKNNIEEIQNYNGEKLTIINEEENNTINRNENTNNSKLNHKNNKNDNKFTITQTILNESDFCEEISPKNTIKVNNYSNNINNINNINNSNSNGIVNDENHRRNFTEDCFCDMKISKRFSTSLKYYTSPLRRKEELLNYYNNNSINPSCVQSLTTSNTVNREQYESPLISNKTSKSIDKKIELSKFIQEINLPKNYVNILLDNGFDDLEVLVNQTKNGIALSEKNLKDIGIKLKGDRAKILNHLEELAGNFHFLLEKDIIYNNLIEENKNNSLYKFLASINLEDYINIFYEKGYYNAELLYIQMVSKNPITEDMLKNEFGLNKIGHIKRILLNLQSCSENYILRLKNKNKESQYYKSVVFDSNPYLKACEACLIF